MYREFYIQVNEMNAQDVANKLNIGKLTPSMISRDSWKSLTLYATLGQLFCRKFISYLPIDLLCQYQQLSETFMHEYRNVLNWTLLCRYQKMSDDFIISHQHEVNFKELKERGKMSLEIARLYDVYYATELEKLKDESDDTDTVDMKELYINAVIGIGVPLIFITTGEYSKYYCTAPDDKYFWKRHTLQSLTETQVYDLYKEITIAKYK